DLDPKKSRPRIHDVHQVRALAANKRRLAGVVVRTRRRVEETAPTELEGEVGERPMEGLARSIADTLNHLHDALGATQRCEPFAHHTNSVESRHTIGLMASGASDSFWSAMHRLHFSRRNQNDLV